MERILIVFDGTRGDAQPYMVAARALIDGGFDVMVSGNGDANILAQNFEVPFVRSRLSAQKVFADPEVTAAYNKQIKDFVDAQANVEEKYETAETKARDVEVLFHLMEDWRPQLILAGGPRAIPMALPTANFLKIPLLCLTLQMMRPCSSIKPVGLPDSIPRFLYYPLWRLVCMLIKNQEMKRTLPVLTKATGLTKAQLNLSTTEFMRYYSAKPTFLSINAYSPAIHGEPPAEFNSNNVAIGALMPSVQQQNTSMFGSEEMASLQDFLAAGDAPVYLGFGSIVCGTSKFMTLLCLRAMKLTGERCVLVRGWSQMCVEDVKDEPDEDELRAFCAEKVLFLSKAPHGWLFPRCKVVVHHGGAGTLNASCLAGRPTIILAIVADQPDHADLVNEQGFGVGFRKMKDMKPEELARAIQKCISTSSIQQKAKEVAEKLAKEDGPGKLVEVVKDYMESHVRTGRHMKQAIQEKESRWCCATCLPRKTAHDTAY